MLAEEQRSDNVPNELDLDEGYWQSLMDEDAALAGGRGRGTPRRAREPQPARPPEDGAGRRSPNAQATLRELQPGDIRPGVVTNLTSFGAFIDIGGFEGLVHVSEVCWSRVGHPRDVLALGQAVDAIVLAVDAGQGRLALSLKRVKPNPWEGIEHRFSIGRVIRGTVTNVVDFGAFVRVEEDLEGLLHVSELGESNAAHPRNVLREGQAIVVRVIGVDGEHHRIALSLNGIE
ncbi:MAG: S1 RNA-binding domain-containing protein [Thermoflexales bacterium]|nr:S1 RNA-binding domain-containing protein [Thermoflexales bacterium]